MFAQSLIEMFGTQVTEIIRIIASVGGAVVGWFIMDPLTRIFYRVSTKQATPGWLLPWTKLTGAGALAAVVYTMVTFGSGGGGSGGGGLGWIPGSGGSGVPVNGAADDKKKIAQGKNNDGKKVVTDDKKPIKLDKTQTLREEIPIEILGGDKLKDQVNLRYYLVKGKEQPFSPTELESYFKNNSSKIQVKIVHTDDTLILNTDEDPTRKLRKLATKYNVPTIGP